MTIVQDALTVLNTLAGKSVSSELAFRLARSYYAGENWATATNEQKAEWLLWGIRDQTIRHLTKFEKRRDSKIAETLAGETVDAEVDLGNMAAPFIAPEMPEEVIPDEGE